MEKRIQGEPRIEIIGPSHSPSSHVYEDFSHRDGSSHPEIITTAWRTTQHAVFPEEDTTTYHSESAGGRMIQRFPIISPEWSAGETIEYLAKNMKKFETINYLYAVTPERKLLGTISIKELLQADKRRGIPSLLKRERIIAVHPDTDQETVVYTAIKEKLKQIPVIDENHILLGIVPSNALLEILSEEFSEDILRLAGMPAAQREPERTPIVQWAFLRMPWLIFGMGGGIIAGIIIQLFQSTLETFVLLAVYFPIMMKTGGDIGTQTSTILVRAFTFRRHKDFPAYFFHEARVGLIFGVVWAVALFVVSTLWQRSFALSLITAGSIFITILVAVTVGTSLPFLFRKIKIDPALASSPIITAIQDLAGLIVYLGIATFIFRIFPYISPLQFLS